VIISKPYILWVAIVFQAFLVATFVGLIPMKLMGHYPSSLGPVYFFIFILGLSLWISISHLKLIRAQKRAMQQDLEADTFS